MKWWCALIQRWLPGYLDNDLSPWGARRLKRHLAVCSHCRQELAELRQVAAIVKSQPVSQPGAEFWENFHLELHRKLAQVNQAPVRTRPYRPYFLVAAGPALAVLVLWVGGYLTPVREPARPRLPMMAQAAAPQQLVYAGLDDGLWQEEEFPSWDVNAVLVDLPDHEQELVLKKVGY